MNRSLLRFTGITLILQGLLIFVPLVVLGAAINWPDSLRDPASIALPRLAEQISAVRLGYGAYFAYSVLFLLTTSLVVSVLRDSKNSALLTIAQGAGALSALARTIGIIRWLVAMPLIASLYVDPSTTDSTRQMLGVTFDALNAYGGSIGEVLGVTTFAALWLVFVSLVILQNGAAPERVLPRWLGVFGLLAAAAMSLNLLELFGIEMIGLSIATLTLEHLWLLVTGALLLRRSGA